MHVVLLSHEYPPFQFGGVGTFVKDLAHGLASRGVDVTVITGLCTPQKTEGHVNSAEELSGNPQIIRFPYPNIYPRHLAFQLFNQTRIYRLIKELNPSIIHGQSGSSFPAILGLKRLAPVVITYHGSPLVQRALAAESLNKGGSFGDYFTFGLGYPSFAYQFQKEYENSHASVAVSKSLMQQLYLELNTKNDLSYVHNGIDLTTMDETGSSFEPELIFGGRIFYGKGVLNIVELANLLQNQYGLDLKITIYGSGPLAQKIVFLKNKHNLRNLVLAKTLGRHEFFNRLRRASFVLLPSFFEASPMLLLESMCLGKTAVMFDLPFSNEFTDNGKHAILATTIKEMAEKVAEAYSDHYPQKMEEKIKSYARSNFDINKTVDGYLTLYEQVSRRER